MMAITSKGCIIGRWGEGEGGCRQRLENASKEGWGEAFSTSQGILDGRVVDKPNYLR